MKGRGNFVTKIEVVLVAVLFSFMFVIAPVNSAFAEDYADLVEIRATLTEILAIQYTLAEKMGSVNTMNAVNSAFDAVDAMTDEDLAAFQGTNLVLADLSSDLIELNEVIAKSHDTELNKFDGATTRIGTTSLTDADYPFDSSRPSGEAYLIAKSVYLLADLVKDVASRGCNQVAVVAGFGANTSLACIVSDTVFNAAKITFELIADYGGLIDSAEIEGVYERAGDIYEELFNHDSDLKYALATHDADLKSDLATHDVDLKNVLAVHDAEMKSILAAHDAEIKSILAAHDAEIKEMLNNLEATINGRFDQVDATLEYIKLLLITPEGKRPGFPYKP